MPKKQDNLCIICKRRKKRIASLFCKTCSKKGVFIKINALAKLEKTTDGRTIRKGMPQRSGRLPKR